MLRRVNPKSPKRIEHNKQMMKKIEDMTSYLENIIDCKHFLLCNHFGEKIEPAIGYCKNHCDNCVCNKNNIENKDITELCKQIIEAVIFLKNDSTRCKVKKFLRGSSEMKKYSSKSSFGIAKKYTDDVYERVLTHLLKEKYLKEKVFRNQFGFYNDKLYVYQKSKQILNNQMNIVLPFLKKKEIKEWFVIKID